MLYATIYLEHYFMFLEYIHIYLLFQRNESEFTFSWYIFSNKWKFTFLVAVDFSNNLFFSIKKPYNFYTNITKYIINIAKDDIIINTKCNKLFFFPYHPMFETERL